jgi:hypothetical protein
MGTETAEVKRRGESDNAGQQSEHFDKHQSLGGATIIKSTVTGAHRGFLLLLFLTQGRRILGPGAAPFPVARNMYRLFEPLPAEYKSPAIPARQHHT